MRLRLALAGLALLAAPSAFTAASFAADAPAGVAVSSGADEPVQLSMEEIGKLPVVQVTATFGSHPGAYEGPLLWTLLDHIHAIDAANPRGQVRQTILVTGRDGYMAVLALGEIAPEFENKQVILAERVDGKPIEPDHLRIVVPGDKRGGRSVRDVVSIKVIK